MLAVPFMRAVPGMLIAALVAGSAAPALATTERPRSKRRSAEVTRTDHETLVWGRVVDRHGRGVAGVSVIATPVVERRPVGRNVVTDHLGRFRIVGLPPGDYWFIGVHGEHPFGMTPAMPVANRLEVAITLDLQVLSI